MRRGTRGRWKRLLLLCCGLALLAVSPEEALAQTCRTSTVTGGSSTVNFVAGLPLSGTLLANTDSLDGSYYELSNGAGIYPNPTVRTMFSTWVRTQPVGTTRPVYFGGVFSNPTNAAITVTEVDVTSNVNSFSTPTVAESTVPNSGWATISGTTTRWTGSISVPAHGAQQFIFSDTPIPNPTPTVEQLTMTVTSSAGTFASSPAFTMTTVSANPMASNAVVGFDTVGGGTYSPRAYVAGVAAGAAANLSVRVRESGNNGANSRIESGLVLAVTIPAGWSAVSVPTAAAPWSAASVVILQPTATTDGSVAVTTIARIAAGGSTPANSLIIRATAPNAFSSANLFPFSMTIIGASVGGRPIASRNEAVAQVLGTGAQAVNTEFLTSTIGAGPVRQIDFRSDFNVINGTGTDVIDVDVFNNVSATWTNIASVTPGASNTTVTQTFTTDFEPYLDALNRMRVRFVSSGTPTRTLRVDFLQLVMTLGYTVNNQTGNDANPGHVARPFQTIAQGLLVVAGSGAVYVEVGASRSGTPYAGNNAVSGVAKSGTALCATLVQGVAAAGLPPLVVPAGAGDVGFQIDSGAAFVAIDGFEIQGGLVGASVENSDDATLSNLTVGVANGSYGVLADGASRAAVRSNTLRPRAGATFPYTGIWINQSDDATVDSNSATDFADAGILIDSSSGVAVQRNLSARNFFGIDLVSTGAVNIYNNTLDSNMEGGIHANFLTGTATTRNNILSRNNSGFSLGDASPVSSDYNNFWANTVGNYFYNPAFPVTPGANDTTNNPLYVNPGTDFRLQAGSPCIDAGVDVGLPFSGAGPDQGAYEF